MTPRPHEYPASLGNSARNGAPVTQKTVLSVFGSILFAAVGWMATTEATARAKMADDIAEASRKIAVLEESNRNVRESQSRIEAVLEDIRRQLQQERRR